MLRSVGRTHVLGSGRVAFGRKGSGRLLKTFGIGAARRTPGLALLSVLLVLTLRDSFAFPAQPEATRASRDRTEVQHKADRLLDSRIAVSTDTGVFVVFEAPSEGEPWLIAPPFLAYWRFRGGDDVLVFNRPLSVLSELGEAILTLRRDIKVDPDEIAVRDARLARALALAVAVEGMPDGEWIRATRWNAMVIAGRWSPRHFDARVAAHITGIVAPPCLQCYAGAAHAEDDKNGGGGNPPTNGHGADSFDAAVAAACGCCNEPRCPPSCDDNDACTRDWCEVTCTTAYCRHEAVNCDDGNLCTQDSCNSSSRCIHVPKNCDDGDVCTQDYCDLLTGDCVNYRYCSSGICCEAPPVDFFCCPAGGVCCRNPDHCCDPGKTCCPGGTECCNPDQTCCNGHCGLKGACCFFDSGSCSEKTAFCCSQEGGAYQGDGTTCSPSDLCKPKCENCHAITGTFSECGHYSPDPKEPCDNMGCIVNTLTGASCDFFPHRLGETRCDTVDTGVPGEVVQRLYQLDIPMICYWSNPDYHDWVRTYRGCGPYECYEAIWQVRCDSGSCAGGTLLNTTPRGFVKTCGCP